VTHHALIARKFDIAVENMRSACKDVAVIDPEAHPDMVQWVFGISAAFEAWKLKHKGRIKAASNGGPAPDASQAKQSSHP